MKMIRVILARLLCWVFPVFMFDACLHRDPFVKVGEHFTIGASSPDAPMYLDYSNSSVKWSEEAAEEMTYDERIKAFQEHQTRQHWQLSGITDFGLSETVISGNSPKRWFIAERRSGLLRLFPSSSERDRVLRDEHHLDWPRSFAPPSLLMRMRSNMLWPWVHLCYAACFILIPVWTIAMHKRGTRMQRASISNPLT